MELLSNLALGFATALTFQNFFYSLFGVVVGTLIGVLPGLGPVATIAVLLPVTLRAAADLGPDSCSPAIYYGAQYGGSTTAILVNLPGESSSVVTCLDGYQMARRGRAGARARGSRRSARSSPAAWPRWLWPGWPGPMVELALKFGQAEYFSLMILGLIGAVVLAHGSLPKAIAMIILGLLLGLVGTDVNSGVARYSFDIPQLTDGIGFVALAMGIFAFAEIIGNLERKEERREVFTDKVGKLLPTKEEFKEAWPAAVRGTLLGSLLGVLPGGGALLASFASYTVEKKISKTPERFGQGAIAGVAGPESANNAGAQTLLHPDADAGHPAQCGDGADDRRDDDPQHPARPAGDGQQPGVVLGV